MKWIAAQIGAREHYAIPRVLHRAGKVETLYTDLWAGTMWQAMGSFLGRPIVPGGRYHKDLADATVESFDFTTLIDSVFGGDLKKNPYDWFQYVGRDFGRSVVESLKKKKGRPWNEMIFFGNDTGFLEPAQWVKARGGKVIVCQMDPSRFEVDLVKEEEKLWPGWAKRSLDVPEAYFQRRESEWSVADLVMVNSEWTRQAMITQGVNVDKIIVVPLAYESAGVEERLVGHQGCENTANFNSAPFQPFSEQNPLRVLFLGQVILRKGIPYLIEAARLLQDQPIHFDVVGPIGISMAYGLPVISTPNCGEVVTDRVDGMIIPPRDTAFLADSIRSCIQNPERLQAMSLATWAKVSQFSLSVLGENLAAVEAKCR